MLNRHIDTAKVAANFLAAHTTYTQAAVVQRKICHELMTLLANRLPHLKPATVLEIGCGTGILTDMYAKIWQPNPWYVNDLYPVTFDYPVTMLVGDVEQIALPKTDLVISSSALQWIKDLPALSSKIYNALKTDGVFAFSSFGVDNLHQLKALTGVGLQYYDLATLEGIIRQAGFELVATSECHHTLYFDHPKDVLRHIKHTGVSVGGVTWRKSSLQAFFDGYSRFGDFDRPKPYPLTYHALYVLALKVP